MIDVLHVLHYRSRLILSLSIVFSPPFDPIHVAAFCVPFVQNLFYTSSSTYITSGTKTCIFNYCSNGRVSYFGRDPKDWQLTAFMFLGIQFPMLGPHHHLFIHIRQFIPNISIVLP